MKKELGGGILKRVDNAPEEEGQLVLLKLDVLFKVVWKSALRHFKGSGGVITHAVLQKQGELEDCNGEEGDGSVINKGEREFCEKKKKQVQLTSFHA